MRPKRAKQDIAEADPSLLHIVYEDSDVIVIDKPTGLCTIAVPGHPEIPTAYHLVDQYVKIAGGKRTRIWIVHRLDRDTSGLLLFAKNRESQDVLRHNWNDMVEDRRYIAVAEGIIKPQQGTYSSYLYEDPVLRRVHSSNHPDAKWAVTHYYVCETGNNYSLVELDLETGRKNQIRVHLSEHGHPVTGDYRYCAENNPIRRMALHAFCLTFHHPKTGEVIDLQTAIPSDFLKVVRECKK
ncbi:MAG: RNA pseudouridine synthase [Marinilabiliaceae bacterium]|nr:RNA pseudouridine synthase [Marinilabiliaceae bacterium]